MTANTLRGHERRSTSPGNRMRRIVMACITETDLDTITVIMLSMQFCLLVGVFLFQERVILQPPPFIDNFIVRLPGLIWCLLIAVGIQWQLREWERGNNCGRRNATLYSASVLGVLCCSLWMKGPGLACAVCATNLWQLVVAARLHNGCCDEKGNDGCKK